MLLVITRKNGIGDNKKFLLIAGIVAIISNLGFGFSSKLGEGFGVANAIFAFFSFASFAAVIYFFNTITLIDPDKEANKQ